MLNRGEAAVLANSLQRMPSGNIYDGFPCVRVGDFLLPSSMDLRTLLVFHFSLLVRLVRNICFRQYLCRCQSVSCGPACTHNLLIALSVQGVGSWHCLRCPTARTLSAPDWKSFEQFQRS